LFGQTTLGIWLSFTVTVKVHDAMPLDGSVAVQVTVVVPFGKVEPEVGLQAMVAQGQLVIGCANVTTAAH
jgi:hypothetical protein